MKTDPADGKRTDESLEALEAELRQDRLDDPGGDFFADMEQRVLREADRLASPRRPWWRAGGLWQWLWQPAPVAALAGAAAVALVVLWVGGPGGPPEPSAVSDPGRTVSKAPVTARTAPRQAPQGDAWFAELPPTEDLWAVEDKDLPVLLALLSAEVGEVDDEPGAVPGDPVGEHSLRGLSDKELRALEQLLAQQPNAPKRPRSQKRPRPRPTMGQAG